MLEGYGLVNQEGKYIFTCKYVIHIFGLVVRRFLCVLGSAPSLSGCCNKAIITSPPSKDKSAAANMAG